MIQKYEKVVVLIDDGVFWKGECLVPKTHLRRLIQIWSRSNRVGIVPILPHNREFYRKHCPRAARGDNTAFGAVFSLGHLLWGDIETMSILFGRLQLWITLLKRVFGTRHSSFQKTPSSILTTAWSTGASRNVRGWAHGFTFLLVYGFVTDRGIPWHTSKPITCIMGS